MIKLIRFLSQRKPVVILALALPILAIFFRGRFDIKLAPENPYPKFQVNFRVPSRTAVEITARVTEPAEKIFNGLPGLLSMESKTEDHGARLDLIFNENVSPNNAYLYLQEKLDRVRLQVPRDVESIQVERQVPELAADLKYHFDHPVPMSLLRSALSPLQSVTQKALPDLSKSTEIRVRMDPVRLTKEGLSITQVTEVLKLTGISTDLGSRGGVMFGIGKAFDQIEELRATVISARGHRPVLLSDIADLEVVSPESVSDLELWIDGTRVSARDYSRLIEGVTQDYSLSRPEFRKVFARGVQPALGLILVILLQIFSIRRIFGPGLPARTIATFDGLIMLHFVFWRGVSAGGITLLDIHALILTLIVGSVLWMMQFARLRTYFLPEYRLKKTPKSIEQANLFALAELIPTFLLLALTFWLFELPVTLTSINLPSRFLLNAFLNPGLPVVLAILIFMPILTDYEWIKDSRTAKSPELLWSTTPSVTKKSMIVLHVLAGLVFLAVGWLPIGVFSEWSPEIRDLRGYGSRLEYLRENSEAVPRSENEALVSVRSNLKRPYQVWQFTPGGLRFLPKLDLLGFSPTMRQLEMGANFGFLAENTQAIPLQFSDLGVTDSNLGSLLLASKTPGENARAVRLLASSEIRVEPSTILRNRMIVADVLQFKPSLWYSNLKREPARESIPTQWTGFVLDQFSRYTRAHGITLVFFMLFLSLYLNSFARAGILVIYALATTSGTGLFYRFLPGALHTDCLWMLPLVPWVGLVAYLVISRVVDVERSRGHDRDLAIEEVRIQFAPAVREAMVFVIASLAALGILDWIPFLPSQGVWREGLFIALLCAVSTWLLFRYIFPVIYLRSEELLEDAAYWILKKPGIRSLVRKLGL